jgi:hypothetical protein
MISNAEFEAFLRLDLDPVKFKLMHESGEGWSAERTATVETEYRRFLYLIKAFPQEHTAPSVDVDTFWHNHILDTVKYAADCEQLFGYFLHHFPYVGMRGDKDLAALERMGERMGELYQETFGIAYPLAANGETETAAWCTRPTARADNGKASWCTFTGPAARADIGEAAWCTFTSPAARADNGKAAWCTFTSPTARADNGKAAWCTFTSPAARADNGKAAWCTFTSPAARADNGKAAWCTFTSPAARADNGKAAWCTFTSPEARADSANGMAESFNFTSPAARVDNIEGLREITALQSSPEFYSIRPTLAR